MAGAFGGHQDWPIPDLGSLCVCCSQPANGRVLPLHISTDRWKADPVSTPVCEACTGHALGHVGTEFAMAGLICAGLGGGLWGFMQGIPVLGVGGLLLAAACGLWLMHRERTRMENTRHGHYPGFHLLIHPGQCVVRTANRQLAQAIVERSGSLVHRVR
jgi:hypothetical protein